MPWSYRQEVRCSPVGDEIGNPGLNCTIVSLHCSFNTWIFISVVSWYVCAQFNFGCVHYLFKLHVHLLRLIMSYFCFALFSSLICPRLYSYVGWLLLKCSAIGIGFNGAETNCGIARILGILLMNSWKT